MTALITAFAEYLMKFVLYLMTTVFAVSLGIKLKKAKAAMNSVE